MNRRQIAAVLTLDAFGISLNDYSGSFLKRLEVQKAVYLAQSKGVEVGHHFSWYVRGPYAPKLTEDMYAVTPDDVQSLVGEWKLDSSSSDTLAGLKDVIVAEPPGGLHRAIWLELLASVHYLLQNKLSSEAELRDTLAKYDKSFSQEQIESALGALKKCDLIAA